MEDESVTLLPSSVSPTNHEPDKAALFTLMNKDRMMHLQSNWGYASDRDEGVIYINKIEGYY